MLTAKGARVREALGHMGVQSSALQESRERSVLGGRLHHRSELADQLEGSIAPGHSGILALVSDPGAVEIRKALAAADAIVAAAIDDVAARDIKAAAKEAEAEEDS